MRRLVRVLQILALLARADAQCGANFYSTQSTDWCVDFGGDIMFGEYGYGAWSVTCNNPYYASYCNPIETDSQGRQYCNICCRLCKITYSTACGPAAPATTCVACPAGSTSPIGSTSSATCACNAGYTGPSGGTCTACVAGKYKSTTGSGACSDCAAGTYLTTTGATAAATCVTCPTSSSSPISSVVLTACICNVGFTGPNGGVCTACVAGKYKIATGTAACTDCAAGTYLTTTGATVATTCLGCGAGTYSTAVGATVAATCLGCPTGKYSTTVGATVATTCLGCPTGSNSPTSSSSVAACTCNTSYTGPAGGPCTTIPALWYRFEQNMEFTNNGSAGATYDLEKLGTLSKLNNVTYMEGRSSAQFTPWTSPDNLYRNKVDWLKNMPLTFAYWFVLTQSTYSTMLSWTTSAGAQAIGFDINDPSQGCFALYNRAPSAWVPTLNRCGTQLNTWYHLTFSIAYPGYANMYIDGVLVQSIATTAIYASGYYGRVGIGGVVGFRGFGGYIDDVRVYDRQLSSTEVLQVVNYCDTYSNADCLCNYGYTGNKGGPCVACVAGTYKPSAGSVTCTNCAAATYSTQQNATTCAACPANTNSPSPSTAAAACTCNAGYFGLGGVVPSVLNSNLARSCGATFNLACSSSQSTTTGVQYSSYALDGDINTICQTQSQTVPDWLRIDFGSTVYVTSVELVIMRAADVDYHRNFWIQIGDVDLYTANTLCYQMIGPLSNLGTAVNFFTVTLSCTTTLPGRYLFFVNPFIGGYVHYISIGEIRPKGYVPCTACPIAKYSVATNASTVTTCVACPANSGASCSGCTAITNCTCNVGYTGPDGGVCTACVAGKYKTATGSAACTDCGAATYSTTVGATVATTCIGCPTSSNSPISSVALTACTCNVGFSGPDGGTCTGCVAGTYKTVTGTAVCNTCGGNTYSTAVAATGVATCVACPTSSNSPISSSALAACTCNAGFTGANGGTCTSCIAGKYKTATGSAVCSDCPTSSKSPTSSSALAACICNPGYTGPNGGPCLLCGSPYYKDTNGSAACSVCPSGSGGTCTNCTSLTDCTCHPGRYFALNLYCFSCPANSGASCMRGAQCTSLTDCRCNSGYTGASGGTCTACVAGKYKKTIGTEVCQTCAINSGGSNLALTTSVCPCDNGYTGGNFFSKYSMTACTRFIALTSRPSLVSVATRTSIPTGILPTYNSAGGPSGKGDVTFVRSSAQTLLYTSASTFNRYSNGGMTIVAVLRCTSPLTNEVIILSDHFTISRSTSDISFQVNNARCSDDTNTCSWAFSTPFCLLNVWSTMVVRYAAQENQWSAKLQPQNFNNYINMPYGLTDKALGTVQVSSNTNSKQYFEGNIAGLLVVDEYITDIATDEIITIMSNGVDLTDTTCPSGNNCTACVAGTYKNVSGTASCTNCTAGAASPVASTSSAACIVVACNVGFTGPDGGTCTSCIAGKYKTATGSAACTDCGAATYSTTVGATVATTCIGCPTSSNSPISSVAFTACTCNVGFTGPDGGPCTTCLTGTWKSATGSGACTGCPLYSGGNCAPCIDATGCQCNAGYSGPNGGSCGACASATYKSTSGSQACTSCPANSGAGGSALTVCPCDSGFSGPDGGVCSACTAGTYKSVVGSTACQACPASSYQSASGASACTPCPANAVSPGASSSQLSCLCNAGYAGPAGSACAPCANSTYKSTAGAQACTPCPSYSVSPAGSALQTNCLCTGGYTGPDGGACTACTAAKYKSGSGSAACLSCPFSTTSPPASVNCFCDVGYFDLLFN